MIFVRSMVELRRNQQESYAKYITVVRAPMCAWLGRGNERNNSNKKSVLLVALCGAVEYIGRGSRQPHERTPLRTGVRSLFSPLRVRRSECFPLRRAAGESRASVCSAPQTHTILPRGEIEFLYLDEVCSEMRIQLHFHGLLMRYTRAESRAGGGEGTSADRAGNHMKLIVNLLRLVIAIRSA